MLAGGVVHVFVLAADWLPVHVFVLAATWLLLGAADWLLLYKRHTLNSQEELVFGLAFDDPLDAVRCAHGAQHLLMLQSWPANASHILGPKEETLDGMPVYYGPRFAMVAHNSTKFTCVLYLC